MQNASIRWGSCGSGVRRPSTSQLITIRGGLPSLARVPSSLCHRSFNKTKPFTVIICGARGGEKGGSPATKLIVRSDGCNHLGSALSAQNKRPFPGPPPGQGPPLRVLPIGGLGEIGMNCMLIGVYDRYILVDAGLMFPDFTDLGMQKILPDTSFLAQWRDKIEAVIITHGHEDHIGALPWVYPALDPSTPIYASAFPMQLMERRLKEFSLYDERRLRLMEMRQPFRLGPFMCEAARVTHSIPDSCAIALRCEHGTIVHTGDWKIDEDPLDGQHFDRDFFEQLGRDGVTLLMSDSTNVLAPGRTSSERVVQESLMRRVMSHQGKGRVIATQFASNIHRLGSLKKAADTAGRKLAFIGMSLHSYLEAAEKAGQAPFSASEVLSLDDVSDIDLDDLLIVTTGSQAEPRAALSLAAHKASHMLHLRPSDLILYSAKVIPGNDTRIMDMMNKIAEQGPEIALGREENLHTSGHAYRGELEEVLRLSKPQHFLPVHGEYAFLCAHAQLARENGVLFTDVIRNGQLLGVHDRRNAHTITTGSMNILGETALTMLYNDGNKGTGDGSEMALVERQMLAVEGIVIAAVDIVRDPLLGAGTGSKEGGDPDPEAAARCRVRANIRITTRAMWVDGGRLLEQLHLAAEVALEHLAGNAQLAVVERAVASALRRVCRTYNSRRPDVVVIAHELDPIAGMAARAAIPVLGRRSGSRKRARAEAAASTGAARRGRRRSSRERGVLKAGKGGEFEGAGAPSEDFLDGENQPTSRGPAAPGLPLPGGDSLPSTKRPGSKGKARRSRTLMGKVPSPASVEAAAAAAVRRAAPGAPKSGKQPQRQRSHAKVSPPDTNTQP